MNANAISPALPVTPAVSTEAGILQASQQITRITYLASLASRFEDVDPLLDPLRGVTAVWDKATPLATDQQRALDGVEAKLKDYLLHTDPLRAFTPESLEERIRHGAETGRADKATRALMLVSVFTLASAGASFVLPLDLSFQNRVLLAAPTLFTFLSVGTVWFYLTSLRNFKEGVRQVFLYFCAAAIVFAIGFSQFLFIELFELTRYPAFRYVGIATLFSIPFVLLFLGLRLYAKLLGVHSRLLLIKYWLPIALIAMAVPLFVPHKPVASELFFNLATTSNMMLSVFASMAMVLAGKIRKQATAAYAKPIATIFWYLLITLPGNFAAVVVLFMNGELQGATLSLVLTAGGILPQSILLYSGYLFKRETGK